MKYKNYDNPFIMKFKTEDDFYIYDVNTNEILKVDEVVYSIIDDIHRFSLNKIIRKWENRFKEIEIGRALEEVHRSRRDDNLFSRKRPVEIKPYGGRAIKAQIEEAVYQHLILNVTENCNLRCKYCVYGGKYPNRRIHSPKRMTRQIAEKALDLFLVKSNAIAEAHIGFYGGEPLSNFDLIRYCVAYVEDRQSSKYLYSMTTNGTLLNEQMMDYLIGKEFKLRISLDGPKEVHDQYRLNRMGQGTWDKVMSNVERLYVKSPKYFEKHVSIISVVATDNYMMKAKEFFEKHQLLSKVGVSASYPNYTPNWLFDEELPVVEDWSNCGRPELLRQCEANLIEKNGLTRFLERFFELEFYQIYNRNVCAGFPAGIHMNGCCFPGQRRLFVSCDGTLFVCERLDDGYPLGSVDEGLRVENIKKLIEDYQELSFTCLNCWAVRFCPKCFASFFSSGKFDKTLRDDDCQAYKNDLEQTFILYYKVLEQNPRAFHFMKEVTLS